MILFENREKYTDYTIALSRVYRFIQFLDFLVKHLFGGMRAQGERDRNYVLLESLGRTCSVNHLNVELTFVGGSFCKDFKFLSWLSIYLRFLVFIGSC